MYVQIGRKGATFLDLVKLFETQRVLDKRIVKEKGLEGQDLLPMKILALQVELGELANEWRGFKFWSEDREPRDWMPNEKDVCDSCNGKPIFYENGKIVGQCKDCDGCGVHFYNPLLEEYVDCLHFILSIGLENAVYFGEDVPINVIGWEAGKEVYKESNINLQFSSLFLEIAGLYDATAGGRAYDFQDVEDAYCNIWGSFIGLGEMLGFTWKQVEDAYYAKNRINHERQATGY